MSFVGDSDPEATLCSFGVNLPIVCDIIWVRSDVALKRNIGDERLKEIEVELVVDELVRSVKWIYWLGQLRVIDSDQTQYHLGVRSWLEHLRSFECPGRLDLRLRVVRSVV